MKIINNIILYTLSLCLIIYLSFLFLIPNLFNLNKYSKIVEDSFFKQTGLKIQLNNPQITTSYNLSMVLGVDKADIFLDKEKFAQVNNLKINIYVIPLIFRTVKISDINADKLILELSKDFNLPKQKQNPKISVFEKLPNVNVNYYRLSLKDGKNKYSIKGNNLVFNENILTKNLNLSAKGSVLTNEQQHIKYDVDITFKMPETKDENIDLSKILDIFQNLKRYSISSDLTIKADVSNPSNIKGNIDLSGFTFVCENKKFPASFANIVMDKSNLKIKSDLFTSHKNKISLFGNFDYGAAKNINLKILSDEVNFKDLILIARTIGKSFGVNIFDKINAQGVLQANFEIKSNLKSMVSNGKMFLKNSKISYGEYSLDRINSEIDFSGNKIKILNSGAFFKEYPVKFSGNIDSNANADISVSSVNIKLKDFANKNILKEYNIDGKAHFNAYLKGNLKDTKPRANLTLSDLLIKHKATGIALKNNETKISLIGSKINLLAQNILVFDKENSLLVPKLNMTALDNNLDIEKGNFWIDNIKAEYSGQIENILTKPNINEIKIAIPTQNNLTGPKNSKISINGDLTVYGEINMPKVRGNINISKLTIPEYLMTVKNVMLTADERGININCPYIEIASSIIRLNAFVENLLSQSIKTVNINADYIDVNKLKQISKNQKYYPNILSGTLKANKIKVNDIVADNVAANISEKDNILYLKKLTADAYSGKIAADIEYNIAANKTSMTLQGRGVDSYNALRAVSGKSQDIHGRCDFDSKLTFVGDSPLEIQKTLTGDVKFIINNFVSGDLGKLDYLIQAQNILSNRVLQSSMNIVKNALKLKDLGIYNFAQGEIHLEKDYAYIKGIKLAGPSMSLFLRGRYNLSDNSAFMLILGRVSDEIVSTLGPLGNITGNTYISKAGSLASAFISDLTTTADIQDISNVPELTVKTNFKTQEFKVLINGDINKETSVQSFKWIKQTKIPAVYTNSQPEMQKQQPLPVFIDKLPEFKQ